MPLESLFLVLWSSGYIGAKLGVPLAGTFTLLLYRYLIVLALAGLYITYAKQWRRPDKHSLIIGFFGHFLWLSAVLLAFENGINAGIAALLAALQPLITIAFAPSAIQGKLSPMQWSGVAMGFLGVLMVVGDNISITHIEWWVYLLPLLATACLSFITIIERVGTVSESDQAPIMTSLFWQGAITAALLLPLAWYFEGFYVQWNQTFVFSVVWLAVVVSIGSYALMIYLIRNRTSSRVSALQYFVPPVTMAIAFIVFGETFSFWGVCGFLVSFAGFMLMNKDGRDEAQ